MHARGSNISFQIAMLINNMLHSAKISTGNVNISGQELYFARNRLNSLYTKKKRPS